MSTIDLQELPASLPDVLARVEAGEEFGIQRDGVTVATLSPPIIKRSGVIRDLPPIGFLRDRITVPDNFKDIARDEIRRMFGEDD